MTNERDYKEIIQERVLDQARFVRATFSGQQPGHSVPWQRVVVRPVEIKQTRQLQFSYFDDRKDITKNYPEPEAKERLNELLETGFKNYNLTSTSDTLQITISRKGKALMSRTKAPQTQITLDLAHNRRKKQLLSDEQPEPFLRVVGIATADGRIKADMRNKFRQINEFLKLVDETGALQAPPDRPLQVIDLGCGNAYLTFAAYHYLVNTLGIPTELLGVDLKADLLAKHTENAQALGWDGMHFEVGRIIDATPEQRPDIVLALHACDTATDEALAQGIGWESTLIVSAPCCHHHLQVQLDQQPPSPFAPVARYGILKERMGDILTDTFRALILRIMGYRTDVVQFVDAEHTARNLMIRAVRALPPGDSRFVQEYLELKRFWQVTPYLETLLGERLTCLFPATS